MEKLLTPLAITMILLLLGTTVYRHLFYDGKRRRVPGQHRYDEKTCVNMMWATVKLSNGDSYEVPIWGYQSLVGVL